MVVLGYFLFILLFLICLAFLYLMVLALASVRPPKPRKPTQHLHRFAIAIPAHNEEEVIGHTIDTLNQLDYPAELVDIYVVADFCSDQTTTIARTHGAICYERSGGERGSKGAALRFLFDRILESANTVDAVIIFDADTQVDAAFIRVMNERLEAGDRVIQGKHVISNPRSGWFPTLTWAMMTIDNRFSNQGRANLGLSAKHMGDSICLSTQVLKRIDWSSSMTDDYELRLQMLLDGIIITYEPRALGFGQAPVSMRDAFYQRLRWAKGTKDAARTYRWRLLTEGLKRRNRLLLDAAIATFIPPYSVLTLVTGLLFISSAILRSFYPTAWDWLPFAYLTILIGLLLYPFLGLALERAPAWAYLVILSGPIFIFWRIWIILLARLRPNQVRWIRTPHKRES
jgi:cellulose synthase/poly-beta-1,6-N-acetylglucosamine synthase-like glycosyltransferase